MSRPIGSKNKQKKQLCKHGHNKDIVGRTKQGACVVCEEIRHKKDYWDNREEQLKAAKDWYDANPEKAKKIRQKYYQDHKAEIDAKNAEWDCLHKEELREYKRKYQQEHKAEHNLATIKCNTNRALRVVAWADSANIIEFERNKPQGMVLDHIIPLQGKGITGLHVSWNLQYLTPEANAHKKNKCDILKASEWYGQILEKEGLK